MRRVALFLAMAGLAQPVLAQTAISTDATGGYVGYNLSLTSPAGSVRRSLLQGMAIVDPTTGAALGTAANPIYTTNSGGSSVPTGTAGSPNAAVVTVQGITNGTPEGVTTRGGASLATNQVSVGTTATLVAAARTNRQKITVAVTTAVQCSYGNSGVTLTTGFPLQAVAGASMTIDTNAALYGVCASAATVGEMEQY